MGKIYTGDIGTKIVLDLDPDETTGISAGDVSSAKITATKPDRSKVEWDASVEGHTVYYITQDGDIDQSGTWALQAHVELTSGWSGRSERKNIMVYA